MNSGRDMASTDLATFGGGTILGAAATIQKGDVVFHRYTLKHVLGVGGMGVVWLANDDKLDQEVALKFVPDALRHDSEAIQDLKNQTKLGLKLTHANIVRVLGFESDDSLAAISMEYVDGPTLASMRVDQPTQVFEADSLHVYLLGILGALEYAHDEAHIVHRDLKPANVMVNSEDRIKVADFGIACSIRNSVGKVMSMPQRSGSGTLHYMSPQQLLGGPASVADDIYSLGATVFELMTGTPPFYSGDIGTQIREIPAQSMMARRQQSQINGEQIPDSWEEVVAAALAKDTSLRPSSAAEFRKGLLGQPFKRGTGTTDAPPSAVVRPVRQTVPSASTSTEAAKTSGLSLTALVSSAVVILIAAISAFVMLSGDSEAKANQEAEAMKRKAALASQVKQFNDQVSLAEKFELESLPPKDKQKRWSDLLAAIRSSEFQDDLSLRTAMQRAQDRLDHWKDESRKSEMAYTVNVNDLKNAVSEATKLSDQKEKGSTAKADKWNELLTQFIPIFAKETEATDHVSILADARKQAQSWQDKAENETPKTLPPEKLIFLGSPVAAWAEHGKKELLKIVQTGLAYKGNVGVTSTGIWDEPTFQALKSWQKEKELPVTGVLDATTLEELGLQAMPEPKPIAAVAQNKPSSSSGGGGGGRSSRPATPAATTNPWLKAVQDRISSGGSIPVPFPR